MSSNGSSGMEPDQRNAVLLLDRDSQDLLSNMGSGTGNFFAIGYKRCWHWIEYSKERETEATARAAYARYCAAWEERWGAVKEDVSEDEALEAYERHVRRVEAEAAAFGIWQRILGRRPPEVPDREAWVRAFRARWKATHRKPERVPAEKWVPAYQQRWAALRKSFEIISEQWIAKNEVYTAALRGARAEQVLDAIKAERGRQVGPDAFLVASGQPAQPQQSRGWFGGR